ncbi:MAG: hypothetical protein WBA89_01895 [Microcoleus sp.]
MVRRSITALRQFRHCTRSNPQKAVSLMNAGQGIARWEPSINLDRPT